MRRQKGRWWKLWLQDHYSLDDVLGGGRSDVSLTQMTNKRGLEMSLNQITE